jgi:hypothetical protein
MRLLLTRGALVLAAGALVIAAAGPGALASGRNGCTVVYINGGWVLACQGGGGKPGGPGTAAGGGGHSRDVCTLKALPAGYPVPSRAPKGKKWMWEVCRDYVNGHLVPGTAALVLVPRGATTASPGITPQQLLQQALADLRVPELTPATAPPRGDDGLVGLPEWFWIPRSEWHTAAATVSVGPVWATATAVPTRLTFRPGGGLRGTSCAGPGVAYNRQLPAAGQHTSCSYTYRQSSAPQPGAAYRASVTVTWTVTWAGSGGAGGVLNAGLQVTAPLVLRIAEGQALVTAGGQ